MSNQNDTKNPDFWDYMIPGGLLLVSYMLIFYLPQELTLKGWIAFGLSVFLFCIGYFGFLDTLPEPGTPTGALIKKLVLVTVATAMFCVGIYYVYMDNGSEKSLAIATLFLIESLVMCGIGSGGNCTGLPQQKLLRNFCIALAAGMAIAGCWFFYREIISETAESRGRIEAATMLWISAAALWYSREDLQ